MPVTSKQPDIESPQLGLFELLYGDINPETENKVAIIDAASGSETTYAELRAYTESAAGALYDLGIKPGDVVALHCPNSLTFVVAAHAVWRLGAVLSPVSLLATEDSIVAQLEDCGASMLLTVAAVGEASANAAKQVGVENVVFLDANNGLKQWLAERRTAPSVNIDSTTHLAALPYSSGTTALPKGVQLTHENLVMNVTQAKAMGLVKKDDVVFGVLPFFHIYGLTALVNLTLAAGATLVTLPRFEVESFLSAHQRYNVTFSFIAPPIAVLLAKHPAVDNYDLSSLRAFFSGAASLNADLAAAVENRLGVHMQQGYGMTETSPMTHINIKPEYDRGAIGEAVANTSHKLVDPETLAEVELPTGEELSEVGELWIHGPQVMRGYLNRPAETAASLTDDGWLRTGDLAVQNAQGHVFIVDRLKELIKYKGYQVPPAELEAALLTHPNVADSAAIGVQREGEEIPKGFVVLQPGVEATEEEKAAIIAHVAARVAPYKKIRELEFLEQIPKSATGKILRRELKQRETSR